MRAVLTARALIAWRPAALLRRRAMLSALVAGAVSGLALPPFHIVVILAITIPVLVLLIAAPVRRAAAVGFCFGFGLHLVGLYWITEAILVEAARFWWLVPLAVPALSAVLALFIAVPCAIAACAPAGWRRVVALAGAWMLADLARQFVATGFPWNPLGSVWAIPGHAGDVMLGVASLIGVHGLTGLTLLLAASPLFGRRAMFAALLCLLAWSGFGAARLRDTPPRAPVAVAVLQGNVAEGHKWDRSARLSIFNHYLDMTRAALAEAAARFPHDTPVVVWPETASPFLLTEDVAARAAIADAAGHRAVVLAGSVRFGADGRPRNSLVAVGPDGALLDSYDKWHLVPFGEFAPSWMPIQVVPGGGFTPGSGPQTFTLPSLPAAGPLICYEAVYTAQLVDEAHRPAWLVNVTNDAWFGNSTGPRQHLAAARMRAVEEGLPLVRAANTGISAIFDALGHEETRLGMNRGGALVAELPGALPMPPAARGGLWIPLALGVLFCLPLLRPRGLPATNVSKTL